MSRILGAIALVVVLLAAPVAAQEPQPLVRPVSFASLTLAPSLQPVNFSLTEAEPQSAPQVRMPTAPTPLGGSKLTLNAMCISFVGLQALDLHSTFTAMAGGAREANPVLGGFASNKAAMVGFKAATTAGTIYLAQKLGVKNRTAATVLMAVVNSAYGIIAAHNYRVAHSLR